MVAQTFKHTYVDESEPSNHRKSDRIFVLERISSAPNWKIDTRLTDGKNCLHAVKDFQLPLWTLQLDHGELPVPLKSSFTSFAAVRKHVEQYFLKRGVKVTEVID